NFQGTDIWSTADPNNSQGLGWLGRYLDSVPPPANALLGWNTTGSMPHVLQAATVGVPAIADVRAYAFASPNVGNEAAVEKATALRISSHVPVDRPALALVYGSSQAAVDTLDRVAAVANSAPAVV